MRLHTIGTQREHKGKNIILFILYSLSTEQLVIRRRLTICGRIRSSHLNRYDRPIKSSFNVSTACVIMSAAIMTPRRSSSTHVEQPP